MAIYARIAGSGIGLALLVAGTVAGGPPAVAGNGVYGQVCNGFQSSVKCVEIIAAQDDRVPTFLGRIGAVTDGPQVLRGSVQRKTGSGWDTVARAQGDGADASTRFDELEIFAGSCPNLDRGYYRVRATFRWTNEGVHYTRRVTSKAVTKRKFC